MKITRYKIYVVILVFILLLSSYALIPRWETEQNNRSAAIVMDQQDLTWIAEQSSKSLEFVTDKYVASGLVSLMIREFTGENLDKGGLPVKYGSLASGSEYTAYFAPEKVTRALLVIPSEWWASEMAENYIMKKMPGTEKIKLQDRNLYLFPASCSDLELSGILPDFEGLKFARKAVLPVIYRPAPSPGISESNIVQALELVLDEFPGIKGIAPSGEVVSSYPKLKKLAGIIKTRGLALAQVEFSRQIGAVQLNWMVYPNILPLHSVTDEEILSRRISRQVLFERMLRAARERSVRLLVMRPSRLSSMDSLLDDFGAELSRLSNALVSNGISPEWPEHGMEGRRSLPGTLAFVLLFLLVLFSQKNRFLSRTVPVGYFEPGLFVILIPVLAIVLLKISFAGRLAGALGAGLLASEASLLALDGWERPLRGILGGFLVAIIGGLAIAAFFSTPFYMLRLRSFSGVKLTLLLPLVLVLFYDLKQRVHPESLGQILKRPPLWGELLLMGILLFAAVLVLFRSGNVQFVSGWEIKFRDMLERVLVARPRNKEIFAGYPCLLLWYLFRRKDLWRNYREVLRLGSTLAFSSVVNSFCHFHTRLYFILLREFNGLWTGMVTGLMAIVIFLLILLPLWKRFKGVVLD